MNYLFWTFCASLICMGAHAQIHKDYPPTVYPDRLILGWQANPATSQSVNWRTDSTVMNAVGAIAEADPSPNFVGKAIVVPATTERIILDGKSVLYHSVHFINHPPDTKYSYRVGDGTHWSEWFQFKTAQDKPAPFSFLYFGDAQNDIRSLWSRAIRGAYSTLPTVNLMIHAGDLITTANADWQWAEWFEAGSWINGMGPTLATPGKMSACPLKVYASPVYFSSAAKSSLPFIADSHVIAPDL